MRGISVSKKIGIGDGLQFSSLPENYFHATGRKLIDVDHPWFFDHNPYVERGFAAQEILELWNFPKKYEWPEPRKGIYISNAEIWASLCGVPVVLNRPRLYKFEEFPFDKRDWILLQTQGKSHGALPDFVIEHVLKKYRYMPLFHIGEGPHIGIPRFATADLWELAEIISKSKMLIGPDSGPAWIAACYPDVTVKKIRTKWQEGWRTPKDWIPLEIANCHSFWDDRAFQIFNTTEEDTAFTMSYRRI